MSERKYNGSARSNVAQMYVRANPCRRLISANRTSRRKAIDRAEGIQRGPISSSDGRDTAAAQVSKNVGRNGREKPAATSAPRSIEARRRSSQSGARTQSASLTAITQSMAMPATP